MQLSLIKKVLAIVFLQHFNRQKAAALWAKNKNMLD